LIGIICLPPSEVQKSEETSLVKNLYPYFLFVSSAFLVATFIVYAIIPELRNIHGVSIMCHVSSLAVTYIGLGLMQTIMHFFNDEACIITGIIFKNIYFMISPSLIDWILILRSNYSLRISICVHLAQCHEF